MDEPLTIFVMIWTSLAILAAGIAAWVWWDVRCSRLASIQRREIDAVLSDCAHTAFVAAYWRNTYDGVTFERHVRALLFSPWCDEWCELYGQVGHLARVRLEAKRMRR